MFNTKENFGSLFPHPKIKEVTNFKKKKENNEQNRTTGMETWNRLTVIRGEGQRDNGGKKGKGLDKEHV